MIGVIADDLTGAAELGAVGLRHGLRAEIVVRSTRRGSEFRLRPGELPFPDLLCVDTDSRSCRAAEAGRRAAAAARLLVAARAEWIYKKVDSVLRGQVTPEMEAIMKQVGAKRALLVPANPALGRVIRDKRYFVRGRPIDETEFAHDPEHPRASASVVNLIAPAKSHSIHVSCAAESLPGNGIVIGEAVTASDLARWAARRKPGTLCAGAAGFFDALLTATGHAAVAGTAIATPVSPAPRELFVCGTTSRSAREFLSAARRRRVPIFSLPPGLARGVRLKRAAVEAIVARVLAALRSHRRVILQVGLPPVRGGAAGRRLARELVRLAGAVLDRAAIGCVFAEGGATSAALVRRMGWRRLVVARELAPGVATLRVEGERALFLTIKPGSYEWPAEIRHGKTAAANQV